MVFWLAPFRLESWKDMKWNSAPGMHLIAEFIRESQWRQMAFKLLKGCLGALVSQTAKIRNQIKTFKARQWGGTFFRNSVIFRDGHYSFFLAVHMCTFRHTHTHTPIYVYGDKCAERFGKTVWQSQFGACERFKNTCSMWTLSVYYCSLPVCWFPVMLS